MIDISVIIPTYKPAFYIWECLDSLCQQTFNKENYEVIVVLNGCDEPYHSQIENWIHAHSDVQWVFIQTNEGGVSNARNIALDVSKGEYITFIDDDDWISPCYLEELYKISNKECVGIARSVPFDDLTKQNIESAMFKDFEKKKQMSRKVFTYIETSRYFQIACMKMFHRSIIQDRRFDVHFKNGEDTLFVFFISDQIKNVQFGTYETIYHRRRRKESANYSPNYKQRFVNSFRLIIAYSKIYFLNIKSYDIRFYLTRVAGAMKTIAFG